MKSKSVWWPTLLEHYQSIIQPPQSSPLRHSLPPWGALATELLKMDKLLGMLTLVLVSASLIKGTVPKEAYTFYISKKYDSQPGQRKRKQSSCPRTCQLRQPQTPLPTFFQLWKVNKFGKCNITSCRAFYSLGCEEDVRRQHRFVYTKLLWHGWLVLR